MQESEGIPKRPQRHKGTKRSVNLTLCLGPFVAFQSRNVDRSKLILLCFCWAILMVLTGCKDANLNFFEAKGVIEFPRSTEVLRHFDDGEMHTWIIAQMDPVQAIKMKDQTSAWHSTQTIRDSDYAWFPSGDTIRISPSLFSLDTCLHSHRMSYLLDTHSGKFWGSIYYPDWGGSDPCQ